MKGHLHSYGSTLYSPYTNNKWPALLGQGLSSAGLFINQAAQDVDAWKLKKAQLVNNDYAEAKDDTLTVDEDQAISPGFANGGHLRYTGGYNAVGDMTTKAGKVTAGIGAGLGVLGAGVSGFADNSALDESSVNAAQAATVSALDRRVNDNSFDALSRDWQGYTKLNTGYTGRNFRTSDANRLRGTLTSIGSGAMAGSAFGGLPGAIVGGAVGAVGSLAGMITGNSKSRKMAREANRLNTAVNTLNTGRFVDRANMLSALQGKTFQRGYYADGGLLIANPGNGPIEYSIANEYLQSRNQNDNKENSPIGDLAYRFLLGGQKENYKEGDILDLKSDDIKRLKSLGYEIEFIG